MLPELATDKINHLSNGSRLDIFFV